MASAITVPGMLTSSRKRSFLIPREHGAWGMLLVPLVAGAVAGQPSGGQALRVLLFATAALALFCLRTPVEAELGISALRPQDDAERRLVHFTIYFYAVVAGSALVALLIWARAFGLILLGAAAAVAFIAQVALRKLGRETRLNSQLTGAIALSSTAAGAYYLATGRMGTTAVILWFINWLFAADQIHFVHLRIHSARATSAGEKMRKGKSFLIHQAVSLIVLGLIWRAGGIPALIFAGFAPLFIRGWAWFLESPGPLQVRRLGQSELACAVVFGAGFIVAYNLRIG